MSNEFTLSVQLRETKGKGASRRLRRNDNLVPGIVYGGEQEPQPISIPLNVITKSLENEAFYSHVLTLDVDGQAQAVVLKDLQRHPSSSTVLHADFQRINENQALHMNVPLHFLNEEKCVGVKKQGGRITHHQNELEVSCLPKDLPEFIEVDLTDLEAGQTLHISDLNLGEGVQSVALAHGADHDSAIVSVQKPGGPSSDEEGAEGDDSAE